MVPVITIGLVCRRCRKPITATVTNYDEYRDLTRDGKIVHLSDRQAIIFGCAVDRNMDRSRLIYQLWSARGLDEPATAVNAIAVLIHYMNRQLEPLNIRLCRVKGQWGYYEFIDLKNTSEEDVVRTKNIIDIPGVL